MTGNTLDKYSQCSIQQEGTRLTHERKVSPFANEERFHTFQTSRVDREPSSPCKVASRALAWKVPRSNPALGADMVVEEKGTFPDREPIT